MSTCGTINLDYRSLYHHFENGCWIYDSDIAVSVRKDFESMIAESREVTQEYLEGKGAGLNIVQMFLRLFAELM